MGATTPTLGLAPPLMVHPTCHDHAVVSDLVLRQSPRVRLVFRPEIVRKEGDPEACLRGRFLYARKRGADTWEDVPRRPLGRLDLDEEYQLELSSDELTHLLSELGPLYRHALAGHVPHLPVELLRVSRVTVEGLRARLEALLGPHEGRPASGRVSIPLDVLRALRKALGGQL